MSRVAKVSVPSHHLLPDKLAAFLSHGGPEALLVALTVCGVSSIEPRFLDHLNLLNVLRNTSYLTIVAIGQMLVMVTGGFDMSVGVVAAAASVVTAMSMAGATQTGSSALLAIAMAMSAGLATGAAIGLINGLCVAVMQLSPFMVTLAMTSVVAGATLYQTKGIPIYGLPDSFIQDLGRGTFLGMPASVVVALAVIAVVWIVQRRMPLGRHIYAVGSNLQAARRSGVSVISTLTLVYVVSGVLAASNGILVTARVGSGQATIGGPLVIASIAAAVVGGVSLRGGSGRVERVVFAALFLSIISNGMNLTRINSKYQTLVLGLVLICAVAIDRTVTRRGRNG